MVLGEYMSSQISVAQDLEFFARVIAACLCGACIGIERSKRRKEVGVRTHIIVCCAAALITIVSKYGFVDLTCPDGSFFNGTRGADPARIAAQVVSGVGFLGAGVIFKNGSTIKGLSSAAGIWATAGIGLAIGSGMYAIGVFTTAAVTVFQIILYKFNVGGEAHVISRLQFTVRNEKAFRKRLADYIAARKIRVTQSRITLDDEGYAVYDMILKSATELALEDLDFFLEFEGVRNISCEPETWNQEAPEDERIR